MNKTLRGQYYESIAYLFLEQKQLIVLKQNLRTSHGEIDLIAVHNNTLCFIEVRSKKKNVYTDWRHILSRKKIAHITSAIEYFFTNSKNCGNYKDYRLDLIFICTNQQKIHWLQGILMFNF